MAANNYSATTYNYVITKMRYLFTLPGLSEVKHGVHKLQALLDYGSYQRMKELTVNLPLTPLLEQQPKFAYKYLSSYAIASFSRSTRLAALLNHYQFLAARVDPSFFSMLGSKLVIWQAQGGEDTFSISLSYPIITTYEGEISLNFSVNSTVVQMVTFVIVPGKLVGTTQEQVILFSQVQGTRNPDLIKYATKTLLDITPATLLIHAAYGLATAWKLTHAIGVSSQQQVSGIGQDHNSFNYDGFWQQFQGETLPNKLFILAVHPPEKPIESVKANHRARTLRKRQYKQELQETVTQHFQRTFMPLTFQEFKEQEFKEQIAVLN
jgi:uncharacterized protein VirK/YbjX